MRIDRECRVALLIGLVISAAAYLVSYAYYFDKVRDAGRFLEFSSSAEAMVTRAEIITVDRAAGGKLAKSEPIKKKMLSVNYEFRASSGETYTGRYLTTAKHRWKTIRVGMHGQSLPIVYNQEDPRESLPREVADRRADGGRVLADAVLPTLIVSVTYLFAAVFFIGYRRQGRET